MTYIYSSLRHETKSEKWIVILLWRLLRHMDWLVAVLMVWTTWLVQSEGRWPVARKCQSLVFCPCTRTSCGGPPIWKFHPKPLALMGICSEWLTVTASSRTFTHIQNTWPATQQTGKSWIQTKCFHAIGQE